MQRSKKIFAAMALTILPAATFAQYPTITKEAQAKIDSMQAAWTAHSDSAWAVAFPIVKQEAMAGRPYVHGLPVHTICARLRFLHSQVLRVAVCLPSVAVAARC